MTPRSDLDERFAEYHRANPRIYDELVRFAREAKGAGRTRVGIKLCIERLRWESFVRGDDGFKVNNLWAARYARLIEEREPDLRGLFTTRHDSIDRWSEGREWEELRDERARAREERL